MTVTRSTTIRNRHGLHARPASEFVKLASSFEAEIRVKKDDLEVNGKSIMGVLMLAAEPGSSIAITGSGEDEEAAVEALVRFVESDQGELEEALEMRDLEGDGDGG